mgnify:CR=1 FL=1
MLTEKLKKQLCSIENRTFESLMDLYEDNYIKLRRLVPNIEAIEPGAISRVSGTIPLFLQVVERQKYTTTLHLTYRFEDDDKEAQHDPAMTIRVYHDARAVEALLDQNASRFNISIKSPQRTEVPLKARWEINHFLNRWLRYCLSSGHSFEIPGFNPENRFEYA